MQPNNRARAFLQAMVTLLIVLVLVVILEVLSHSPDSTMPGVLAAIPQSQPSPTIELKSPIPTRTSVPAAAAPLTALALGSQDVQSAAPAPTGDVTQDPQPTANLDPVEDWMSWPIIPGITDTARQIYQKGLELGNNSNAFSKIGDCNTLSPRFLTYFDGTPASTYYNLEAFSSLQEVVNQFSGSFKRESLAVGDGWNTSAILSPFRADLKYCDVDETPLDCEYRVHKPGFALIAIGTDDYLKPAEFEANLRKIVEITINDGIVPILATKVDNANQLNYNPIIAQVAEDYDIPLWNLWLAFQPLPAHGLEDNMHPSGIWAAFDFTSSNLDKYGWPIRNLTALQVLNTVWQGVTQ